MSDTTFAPTLMCEFASASSGSNEVSIGGARLDFLACPVGVYVVPMAESIRWVRVGEYVLQIAIMHSPASVMKNACK